ncbi:hypothetical protein Tco_0266739 [Tanacetum coccineum]
MSTHEQQTTNNPASAVRNTGGRNGPQGLEEPMSEEILREMCDKNYHQLLPLIAEKMQKEKEQKDKLNAVKARLIYGDESGTKIRNREESQYSESKTPTARTEQRRKHGDRHSRSPSPHASVFKRLRTDRAPSPRPRLRKEGGVFNRLGRKEPATSEASAKGRGLVKMTCTSSRATDALNARLVSAMVAKGIRINEEQFILDGSSEKPLVTIKVQIANVESRFTIAISESGEIVVEGRVKDGFLISALSFVVKGADTGSTTQRKQAVMVNYHWKCNKYIG